MKRFLTSVLPVIILILNPNVVRADSPADPQGIVLQQFDRYDLVAVSEFHRAKEVHTFLTSLVRDPRFCARGIKNIVVEFGNARYQKMADRYVTGGDVPLADLEKIWRDTTMFMEWDSPLYGDFFRTVRDVNRGLPPSRQIRIVLGDPPIGWEIVHSAKDYEQYADRDLFYAETVEREILNHRQKALLIAGGMHFINAWDTKKEIPDRRRSAGDLLHRRHPGKLFVFWHTRKPLPGAPSGNRPQVVVTRGKPLGQESFAAFAPEGILVQKTINGEKRWVPLDNADWPSVNEMTDGLIFYGSSLTTVDPLVATYQESSYVKELRRRAAILSDVYGMDFTKELEETIAQKDGP